MKPRLLIVAVAVTGVATLAHADCDPPPSWQNAATRGHPTAEISACLKNKAYDARNVAVPAQSKSAGIIAQCEVEVDRYEGGAPFGGAKGWNEPWVAQQAMAAVAAYQSCAAR